MAIVSYVQLQLNSDITVDEFKAWLHKFDMDEDGSISLEELKDALESLGIWFAWWKARQGVKAADVNRNGEIEFDTKEIEKLVNYARQQLHMKIYEDNWQ